MNYYSYILNVLLSIQSIFSKTNECEDKQCIRIIEK